MNCLQWNKITISIPCNLGQMSEKRINSIIADLNNNGIEVNSRIAPGPIAFALVVDQGKANIISDINALSFIRVIDNLSCMKQTEQTFQKILNAFLIDDNNQFVFNLEGTFDTEDSHKESIDTFNKHFSQDITTPIYGIGYRFLMEDHTVNGELKIEPLIADKTKFYIQVIFNTKMSLPASEAFELLLSKLKSELLAKCELIIKG